ncbi:MAG: hypothetical protein RLZZ135_912 [Cyanobacteriota bacterium]
MLHKKSPIGLALNFSDFPERIVFQSPATVNLVATGFGRTVRNSGTRWWDASVIPASSVINGVAGDVITLPFTKNFLAPYTIDLICEVFVNGIKYVYAASNSPDNQVVLSPPVETNLYYLELFAMGLNNSLGSNSVGNNYMQGGNQTQGETQDPAKLFLSEPASVAGSFTISAEYIAYNGSAPLSTFVGTYPYLAGAQLVNVMSPYQLVRHYFDLFGYITHTNAGYYKISVTNSAPGTRSLLNFYHWGVG